MLKQYACKAQAKLQSIPEWFIALSLRIGVALVFFYSARTKVEGFLSITDTTYALFESEYALPLIPAPLAAFMATYAEHIFSILLILGLATRLSAVALLLMTATIQIFVYPGAWNVHLFWAAALLYCAARGGGKISLDHYICKKGC
ncbi:MAG: DoxX family protein [Parvibaculales bacterium]